MDARLLRRSSLGRLVRGAALVVEEVAVGSAGEGPRHRLVALLDKGVLDLAAARRSARVSGTRKDPWYSAVKAGGWGWVVCCGPHLLILVVAVRVVAHEDEAHVQADDRQEDERNLLPLVGLSCARKTTSSPSQLAVMRR